MTVTSEKTAQALWNDWTCAVDVCNGFIFLLHANLASTYDVDALCRSLHTAALQVIDDGVILSDCADRLDACCSRRYRDAVYLHTAVGVSSVEAIPFRSA